VTESSPGPSLPSELVDYESQDLERGHYITALLHLYRGEMSRANTWRSRLDQTTNWAVFVTASALGFAFGHETASHFSLLFANLFLVILLGLEARRYRFFDVWRTRVRRMEVNFFAPILQRKLASPQRDWALFVARDLAEPHFHLSRLQAVRLRLVGNYLPIFAVVLLAWGIKLCVHPWATWDPAELYRRCAVGPLPGWITLGSVAAFYAALGLLVALGHERAAHDTWDIGEVIPDETL